MSKIAHIPISISSFHGTIFIDFTAVCMLWPQNSTAFLLLSQDEKQNTFIADVIIIHLDSPTHKMNTFLEHFQKIYILISLANWEWERTWFFRICVLIVRWLAWSTASLYLSVVNFQFHFPFVLTFLFMFCYFEIKLRTNWLNCLRYTFTLSLSRDWKYILSVRISSSVFLVRERSLAPAWAYQRLLSGCCFCSV